MQVSDEIAAIIINAIHDANESSPGTEPGATRERLFETPNASRFLASAVIDALGKAGYRIVRAEAPES